MPSLPDFLYFAVELMNARSVADVKMRVEWVQ